MLTELFNQLSGIGLQPGHPAVLEGSNVCEGLPLLGVGLLEKSLLLGVAFAATFRTLEQPPLPTEVSHKFREQAGGPVCCDQLLAAVLTDGHRNVNGRMLVSAGKRYETLDPKRCDLSVGSRSIVFFVQKHREQAGIVAFFAVSCRLERHACDAPSLASNPFEDSEEITELVEDFFGMFERCAAYSVHIELESSACFWAAYFVYLVRVCVRVYSSSDNSDNRVVRTGECTALLKFKFEV